MTWNPTYQATPNGTSQLLGNPIKSSWGSEPWTPKTQDIETAYPIPLCLVKNSPMAQIFKFMSTRKLDWMLFCDALIFCTVECTNSYVKVDVLKSDSG